MFVGTPTGSAVRSNFSFFCKPVIVMHKLGEAQQETRPGEALDSFTMTFYLLQNAFATSAKVSQSINIDLVVSE
jgi:hypothetical protein